MSGLNFDLDSVVKNRKKKRAEQRKAKAAKVAKENYVKALAAQKAKEVHDKALAESEKERLALEQELLKEQEELELTAGVRYKEALKAFPLDKADTNRVTLPASVLDQLLKQNGLEKSKVLTFELTVVDETGKVLERTYAGVEEFTAEEGTIGLPPKTALSLTKNRGLDWLKEHPLVHAKYVVVDTAKKAFMRIQPRGAGFHATSDTVSLDLKHVLERTLNNHFVIAKNDWIPLYHAGLNYELIVKDLAPEDVLIVLNTELEVDLTPSEDVENEQLEQEMYNELLQKFQTKVEQCKEKVSRLAKPEKGKGIRLKVMIPKGQSSSNKGGAIVETFDPEDSLGDVLDWVISQCDGIQLPEGTRDEGFLQNPIQLVQSFPGQRRVFNQRETQLKSLGFSQGGERLIAEWVKVEPVSKVVEEVTTETQEESSWNDAAKNVMKHVEEAERSPQHEPMQGVVSSTNKATVQQIASTFRELLELGVDQATAEKVSRQYSPQIQELKDMGLGNRLVAASKYLIKWNGAMLRTTNSLFTEEDEEQELLDAAIEESNTKNSDAKVEG